jgi:hypothetical protein
MQIAQKHMIVYINMYTYVKYISSSGVGLI